MDQKPQPEALSTFFHAQIRDALRHEYDGPAAIQIELYLTELLVNFLHEDQIFKIRDAAGQRVSSVTQMLEYGDIRLKASSFDEERRVHRHIGDFLLFWSGIFPEFLPKLAGASLQDISLNCAVIGSESYDIVSSFTHEPYGEEAKVFRKLSDDFMAFQRTFLTVRKCVFH